MESYCTRGCSQIEALQEPAPQPSPLHSAPQTSHHSHACPPVCRTRHGVLMAILVPPLEPSVLGGSREAVLEGSESSTASFQTFSEYGFSRVAAAFSSFDGDLSLPLGLALGSPTFPSSSEGKLGFALERGLCRGAAGNPRVPRLLPGTLGNFPGCL